MSARGLGKYQFIEGTVNAEKYQEILQNSLLPTLQFLHPQDDFIFQQDGAACHTAKTTKKRFGEHNINEKLFKKLPTENNSGFKKSN
jgi:hypothetical protein